MHLILFNIILLLLLPNPTLQVRVTFTNAHQIPHSQHWAAQACSNVLITECCAPLNLNVPGIGDRWFRATTAHFTHLPPVSLYLSLWRGQGAGYVCRGATLGDEITDGKPNLKYIDTSGFGLGGAWFTQWVSHENKTGVAATPQLVYPDEILYLGALYKEVSEASGIFRNAAGIFIYGLPFDSSSTQLRKPTIPNNLLGGGSLRFKTPNFTTGFFSGGAGGIKSDAAPGPLDTSK